MNMLISDYNTWSWSDNDNHKEESWPVANNNSLEVFWNPSNGFDGVRACRTKDSNGWAKPYDDNDDVDGDDDNDDVEGDDDDVDDDND